SYVDHAPKSGSFPLVQGGRAATLIVESGDWKGVVRTVGDLQADIRRVTNIDPVIGDPGKLSGNVVVVGTIGKSPLIDRWIQEKRIDATGVAGKWESFVLQTISNPLPGVPMALVIAGSDKRGTIYGVYDLSEQIGVSPWYWWADVTPTHADAL